MTRIKICGITRAEDGEKALELGANALGFVFEPTSPRYVRNFEGAAELPRYFGPLVTTFAVYGKLRDEETGARYRQCIKTGPMTSTHGAIMAIRLDGKVKTGDVVKAMHRMERWTPDFFLLDAYDPDQYGGTGKTIDWGLAAEIVSKLPERRIILAGGLTPENVTEAIRKVKPYGVDVSSGVESQPGLKDHAKLAAFIEAVHTAN